MQGTQTWTALMQGTLQQTQDCSPSEQLMPVGLDLHGVTRQEQLFTWVLLRRVVHIVMI